MLKNNSFLFKVPAYIKLVFVMLFCLITLCSCGGGDNGVAQKGQPINNPSAKPIVTYPADAEVDFNDTELGWQIRQDYLNHHRKGVPEATINDVWVRVYYGDYNGSVPVMMYARGSFYADVVHTVVVADVSFHYYNGNVIIVWEQGKFYSLQDAYDLGLLTQEDLSEIADLHNLIFWIEN